MACKIIPFQVTICDDTNDLGISLGGQWLEKPQEALIRDVSTLS